MNPVTKGPRMEVIFDKPLVMPMRKPAKLGERSKWLHKKPVNIPALRARAVVSRITTPVGLLMNPTDTRAIAPPQCAEIKFVNAKCTQQ